MAGNYEGLDYEDTELNPAMGAIPEPVDEPAIPEGDAPTGAAPAIPDGLDESAGLDMRKRRDPNATPTSGLLADAENTAPVQGIRKLVSYLMGGGSAPPQEAQRAVAEIKQTNPGISDDDANLLAVHQAGQMGGPGAAWGMVQYNRTAYNAKQSFAKAALNGIDGKAGDLAAAADAATKAGAHVIDGSTAVFSAGPGGITATVTDPQTRERQQYNLTPQQFSEYLDVGKVGQWDKVMAQGIGPTLTGITKSTGPQMGQIGNLSAPTQPEQSNFGTTPSTLDLSGAPKGDLRGYKPLDYSAIDDPKSSLIARANQLFPSVSQQEQRTAWIAAQSEREDERENKLGVAKAGQEGRLQVARETGTHRENAAQTRATGEVAKQTIRSEGNLAVADKQAEARAKSDQQKAAQFAAKLEQQGRTADERERGKMARAEIMNPNFLLQSDEQRNAVLKKYGIGTNTPQAPTPGAAPQGGSAGPVKVSSPSEANKLQPGTVYVTPDGRKFTR
jgi:hypothetical protein